MNLMMLWQVGWVGGRNVGNEFNAAIAENAGA